MVMIDNHTRIVINPLVGGNYVCPCGLLAAGRLLLSVQEFISDFKIPNLQNIAKIFCGTTMTTMDKTSSKNGGRIDCSPSSSALLSSSTNGIMSTLTAVSDQAASAMALESTEETSTRNRPTLYPTRKRRRAVRPHKTQAQQQQSRIVHKKSYVLDDDDFIPLDFTGIPTDDEEESSQLNEETNKLKKNPYSSSLPILLMQREYGCYNNKRGRGAVPVWHWQRQMLTTTSTSTTTTSNASSSWHAFAHRQIPFTALETPTSEAVLALNATGSYAVSLSFMNNDKDNNDNNNNNENYYPRNNNNNGIRYNHLHQEIPSIALRFYGIPGQCIHQKRAVGMNRSGNHMIVAPNLLTIPLEYASSSLSLARLFINNDSHVFGSDNIIPAIVELCISSDWRIGIGHVRPIVTSSSSHVHEGQQQQQQQQMDQSSSHAGSVVIFPLPGVVSRPPPLKPATHHSDDGGDTSSTTMIRTLKARHVSLVSPVPDGKTSLRGRNLLWMVDYIPQSKSQSSSPTASTTTSMSHNNDNNPFLVTGIVEQPAYLYLMDDSEGFRLTWIVEEGWDASNRRQQQPVPAALPLFRYQPRSQVLTAVSNNDNNDSFWTESCSDRQTGCRYEDDDDDESDDDDDKKNKNKSAKHEMKGQLGIAMEVRLGVVELLMDILRRNPKWLMTTTMPSGGGGGDDGNQVSNMKDESSMARSCSTSCSDYQYELISMTHQGRVAQLLITFCAVSNTSSNVTATQNPWIGVIVAVDLWKKGRYQVLNFIKTNKSTATASTATTTTTMNLYNPAVSHRMRELGLGPYCIQNNDPRNWAQHVCREPPNQTGHAAGALYDNGDDINPEIWNSFLQAMNRGRQDDENENDDNDEGTRLRRRQLQQQQQQPPSYVSLSSVYPDCDTVSNHTVLFGLPVMSLKASAAPMELVYG